MLPSAAVRSPAAARIAASIVVVVVLPLVPVTAEPGGRVRAAQPPGQLRLAVDRQPGRGGGPSDRRVRGEAGRDDHLVDPVEQARAAARRPSTTSAPSVAQPRRRGAVGAVEHASPVRRGASSTSAQAAAPATPTPATSDEPARVAGHRCAPPISITRRKSA